MALDHALAQVTQGGQDADDQAQECGAARGDQSCALRRPRPTPARHRSSASPAVPSVAKTIQLLLFLSEALAHLMLAKERPIKDAPYRPTRPAGRASRTHHSPSASFERGRDQAGTDFTISLAGGLYRASIPRLPGFSLRQLPEGLWWVLLALPAVWLADTGGYFIGRSFGKHKMSKRLSPKKSWEGYFAGIVFATLGTAGLALLRQYLAGVRPGGPLESATLITPRSAATPGP